MHDPAVSCASCATMSHAGGAMMDAGCYCVHALRTLAQAAAAPWAKPGSKLLNPRVEWARAEMHPGSQVCACCARMHAES